jgi:hypothetical protein
VELRSCASGAQKRAEIVRIAGDHDIAMSGQQCQVRIDDIVGPNRAAKIAHPSGYGRPEGALVDAGEEPGESSLTGTTTSPRLRHCRGRRHG